MSQTWTADTYAGTHIGQTDLQNMENNLLTLKSCFSGTGAPSNTVAGMPWFDTTNDYLRIRNAGNSAWYGVMHGDTSQKIWVYRNSAMAGWVVTATSSDRVLAAKGGGTYVTGGASAGSWTISGLTVASSHTHGIGSYKTPTLSHTLRGSSTGASFTADYNTSHAAKAITGTSGSGGSGTSISSTGAWKPLAYVNTLQHVA